ncbi:MAG: SpoIIE family protein phosphatase [Spirochaetota bacterium]
MKKFFLPVLLILFLCPVRDALPEYYWDNPRLIQKTSPQSEKLFPSVVPFHRENAVFYLKKGRDKARVYYYLTRSFDQLKGPYPASETIDVHEGFIPQYQAFVHKGYLYLVWNTIDGDIKVSRTGDRTGGWKQVGAVEVDRKISFKPEVFSVEDSLYLFYHTGSQGRRIDHFYTRSDDGGRSWSDPYQIARGFAGSFFPHLVHHQGSLYVVWQSRPFSRQQAPLFDIYLSIKKGAHKNWLDPINLTSGTMGENVHPHIFFHNERLILVWESDRKGTWNVYYREYRIDGTPIGQPVKVSRSLANAQDAAPVFIDGKLYIFYIDQSEGFRKVSYSVKTEKGFEHGRAPESIHNEVLHYFPASEDGELYLLLQNPEGISLLGPDSNVQPVKLLHPPSKYISPQGVNISWEKPEDPSGIRGYCFNFSKTRTTSPEVMNLSEEITTLELKPEQEGTYYFQIRAVDKAGNLSETVTVKLTADFTPPPRPLLEPVDVDEKGFYPEYSPSFEWSRPASDVIGYNYLLSRKEQKLDAADIRTTDHSVSFRNPGQGKWYFNIAAVDRAGNISETTSVALRMKAPPAKEPVQKKPQEKAPEKLPEKKTRGQQAPSWRMGPYTLDVSPFFSSMLYIAVGGVFIIALIFSLNLLKNYISFKKGVQMEQKHTVPVIRKKGMGLRFKFSLMIGLLVILLTMGIGASLSLVTIEHEKKALATQMMDKARLTLDNMTNVAKEGILNDDQLMLISVISRTMENQDIQYAAILNKQRKVIAHSDINQMGNTLHSDFALAAASSSDRLVRPEFSAQRLSELYQMSSPVMYSDQRIGTAILGYSTQSIFNTIQKARRNSIVNTIIITVVTIVLGIGGAVAMASITIKPLKVLAAGANIIGQGKLDYKIKVKARDEIGLLADEFNRMTERLLAFQKESEKRAKLDQQIEIAREIQQNMIPGTGIDNQAVSIDGYYRAAAGVGGDYYDFIHLEGTTRYCVIMSDVSGKGVPAALMMIMIRTLFRSSIQSGVTTPDRVASMMNSTLASEISSDRFATMLFGIYDSKTNLLRYTNAGYGPILVYKNSKKSCFMVNPPSDSLPLGVMPDTRYSECDPITLEKGDAVFLFTDGIHEARNENKQEYGMHRLSQVIPGFAHKSSREMANLIIEDVARFMGKAEQFDDMTLLVMKIKQNPG